MSEELSILNLVLQSWPRCTASDGDFGAGVCFLWVVIFQRTRVLSRAKKHARLFEDTFGAELSWSVCINR